MGSLANSDAQGSDAWRSMVALRKRLVLELFVQHGQFWEAVSEVRQRRNITPIREVPPADFNSRGTMRYQEDVYRIRDAIIPKRHYKEGFTFDWLGFIYACLLYQPPKMADALERFAAFGSGPYPFIFVAPGKPSKAADEPPPRLDDLPGPDKLPRPDDAPQMLAPPVREYRDEQGVVRHYITVDEHTEEEDVLQAFRKISATLKQRSQGGRPKRDRFIAVQCAILYDEENAPDAEDRRRKRWTHAKLADWFGLNSVRAAKAHVELGREILAGKVTLQ